MAAYFPALGSDQPPFYSAVSFPRTFFVPRIYRYQWPTFKFPTLRGGGFNKKKKNAHQKLPNFFSTIKHSKAVA
jgi:hypothetical protein